MVNLSTNFWYLTRVFVEENKPINTPIQTLEVVNQQNYKVDCTMVNEQLFTDVPFTFIENDAQKHCILRVRGLIDYERQNEYVLNVRVDAVSQRRKRQAGKKCCAFCNGLH